MADEKNAALAEYGLKLTETVRTEGWKHLLDMMNGMVEGAESDLIEYRGSDPITLLSLQKRALAYRTFYQNFQAKVYSEIERAKQEPPQAATGPFTGLDESSPYQTITTWPERSLIPGNSPGLSY